jgi:hypothetical protein
VKPTAGASSRGGGAALEGDLIFDPQPPERLPTSRVDVTDDVDHRASSFEFPYQVKYNTQQTGMRA